MWMGDYGPFPIPDEFKDVPIRKDGWPDQRFNRGRNMVSIMRAMDRDRAHSKGYYARCEQQ